MKIRQVNKKDEKDIYEFVKIAFQTAKVSDGTEQDFVLRLRASENYIPALELVAEEEGQLIGHIMLTKQKVITQEGEYLGVLVAPLSVKLENRNQGIGKVLIQTAFEKAKALGYTAAFLVGDFQYYCRFGFKPINTFSIQNLTEIPDEFVLGCELKKDSLKEITGTLTIIE